MGKLHIIYIAIIAALLIALCCMWQSKVILWQTTDAVQLEPGTAITIWAAVLTIVFLVFTIVGLINIDHKLYVEAEQKDKKIASLSETNNMYRSIISISLLALLMKLYRSVFEMKGDFGSIAEWVLLAALLIIFILAYKKQTKYIVSRIDYHTKKS